METREQGVLKGGSVTGVLMGDGKEGGSGSESLSLSPYYSSIAAGRRITHGSRRAPRWSPWSTRTRSCPATSGGMQGSLAGISRREAQGQRERERWERRGGMSPQRPIGSSWEKRGRRGQMRLQNPRHQPRPRWLQSEVSRVWTGSRPGSCLLSLSGEDHHHCSTLSNPISVLECSCRIHTHLKPIVKN